MARPDLLAARCLIGRRSMGNCRRSLHACRFQSSFWIWVKIWSRTSPAHKIIMHLLNKDHSYSDIQRQKFDFSRRFDIACTEHLQLSLSAFFTVGAPANLPSSYPRNNILNNHRISSNFFSLASRLLSQWRSLVDLLCWGLGWPTKRNRFLSVTVPLCKRMARGLGTDR